MVADVASGFSSPARIFLGQLEVIVQYVLTEKDVVRSYPGAMQKGG